MAEVTADVHVEVAPELGARRALHVGWRPCGAAPEEGGAPGE